MNILSFLSVLCARAASDERFNDEVLRLSEELQNELSQRIGANEAFPKGTVEAYKVLMQGAARQAAMRDESSARAESQRLRTQVEKLRRDATTSEAVSARRCRRGGQTERAYRQSWNRS